MVVFFCLWMNDTDVDCTSAQVNLSCTSKCICGNATWAALLTVQTERSHAWCYFIVACTYLEMS